MLAHGNARLQRFAKHRPVEIELIAGDDPPPLSSPPSLLAECQTGAASLGNCTVSLGALDGALQPSCRWRRYWLHRVGLSDDRRLVPVDSDFVGWRGNLRFSVSPPVR